MLEGWTLGKPIGKGCYGEVFLTSKQGSKEKYATKRIDKKKVGDQGSKKYLINEIDILEKVKHPNIIKLCDKQETLQYYFLIMEYCNGGTLLRCLEEYKKMHKRAFDEEIVQHFMKQILQALYYLHEKNILHRDLKLENILVHYNSEEDRVNKDLLNAKIKLIDFGFARYLDPGKMASSILGSPMHMDPIILKKYTKSGNYREYEYDEKADIWSLGTICYEMLIGKSTFDADSLKDLLNKVEKGDFFIPTSLTKESVSFLNAMLQYDKNKRLSAKQLLNHSFLRKPYKQLTRIDLTKVNKYVNSNNLIKGNTRDSHSIWIIFDSESTVLDNIPGNLDGENKENLNNNDIDTQEIDNKKNVKEPPKCDPNLLKFEFAKAFQEMNEDFIYIEPRLIPIVPGDDPAVINKISEANDN